jgi:hypothetical protein
MALTKTRPKLHDQYELWDRDDWREEVASENTILGYWEWVSHQIEATEPPKHSTRCIPAKIASLLNPYDLWGMPHAIKRMPEAAQFAQILRALIDCQLEEEQWDLIAEHMCLEIATLEITQSIEDHNA